MSLASILENHENDKKQKQEEIKRIEKQIASSASCLTTKLKKHFQENPEETFDCNDVQDSLSQKQIISVCEDINKTRGLREEEISDDLLCYLERQKGENSLVLDLFERADKKMKLRIAMFCSGYHGLSYQYKEIGNYLKEEYLLDHSYGKESNYIAVDGYNFEYKQSGIKIVTEKDNFTNLDKFAVSIAKLREDGYKVPFIEIFEHSLSANGNYALKFIQNEIEGDERAVPCVCDCYGCSVDVLYKGEGETIEEQIESCLKYIAKNVWYSGEEDDDDELY